MTNIKYPNLSDSKIISFDIETYDPGLLKKGPGVYRRDGNILGVALANEDGFSEYYNIAHPDCTTELKQKNIKYITNILKLPCQKIGTNILYDLDWLENWLGIKVNGNLHDIKTAECLIDENRKLLGIKFPYSLDELSKKYLGITKYKTDITKFCEKHNLKGDPRKWLWKMNSTIVAPYAKTDVINPLEIFRKQWSIMKKENLLYLYDIEMGLYRLLLLMRKVGVRVDKKHLNNSIVKLNKDLKEAEKKLYIEYGKFNYRSSKQVAVIFDKLNIPYNYTLKGNPNIDKDVLQLLASKEIKIAQDLLNVKKISYILNTTLIKAFFHRVIKDRIHCSFYPTSTDEYGTKSGRFSSANPNLQDVAADKIYAPICRGVFIPEEGYDWIKADYSQIEYRFIAHYATGPKSDEIRRKYNEDPNTDYHKMIMEWTGLDRRKAKNLNFGTAYFMGVSTCAKKFWWTEQEAKEYLELYFATVPYIKTTRNHVVKVGKQRGYIKTILNRRARVTKQMKLMGKEHSLFNRLIQGSAADEMKKGMHDAYKAGIFNVLIPHLTVHDELDFSKPRTKIGDEATIELKHIMENTIKLKVPIKVDMEIGPNWGQLEDYEPGKPY